MDNDEMMKILDSQPIRFGLVAQGHIPTVERMLAEDASWDDIGKEIGWCPKTAEKHYGWYLENKNENN